MFKLIRQGTRMHALIVFFGTCM